MSTTSFSSSDESQGDDQHSIDERFTGGITENHETQDVDIVFKNRRSSVEIKILPSKQTNDDEDKSNENNLPERDDSLEVAENHVEGASNK